MTLEILVSSALMGYTMDEQTKILTSIETGSDLPTARLKEGAEKVIEIFEAWEPTVEGYAGFPVDRDQIKKKKEQHKDDRNVGRVVQSGGNSFVITGKKSDGRYIVVGKKGEKTAKNAGDIGLNMQREAVGIDIEDLHQMMIEKKMDGVDDNGFTSCWKGYKKRGYDEAQQLDEVSLKTKMSAFQKRATDEFESDGDNPRNYTKSGASKADKTKANIVKKHGEKAGQHAERAAHTGIFGRKSFSMPKKPTKEEVEYVDEKTAMAKRGHDETAIRNKIASNTGGGKSADRATALADKPTFGNDKAAKQRSDLARKQRGDFRKTTSSSPGLHGYAHKSDDPKVKAKQAARGAQRGALTPNEKKSLNREQVEFINKLSDSGLFTEAEIDRIMEGME
jgi:hypothetical protein